MSTKEREPLLSDEQMQEMLLTDEVCIKVQDAGMRSVKTGYGLALGASLVRDFYETARAKDAELIQKLVDAIEQPDCHHPYCIWVRDQRNECDCHMAVLAAAKAAGFTPSEP